MKLAYSLSAFAFLLAIAGKASALPIVVDGDLTDWGVTISDNNSSVYSVGDPSISYVVEDTDDNSNSYAVGPNYGGQNYDAQFLGITVHNNILNIGIASGQRPDNGLRNYSPGDIYIDINGIIYGMGSNTISIVTDIQTLPIPQMLRTSPMLEMYLKHCWQIGI